MDEGLTLYQALRDPAYASPDRYVGDAGITWLHRWAITQGRRGAVFAGEPEVPKWVERAAVSGRAGPPSQSGRVGLRRLGKRPLG